MSEIDKQLDKVADLIAMLSDGNVGALTVLSKIFHWNAEEFFQLAIVMLNTDIPGWWVWLAYKDYAKFDLELTCAAIINQPDEFMKLVQKEINDRIESGKKMKNFDKFTIEMRKALLASFLGLRDIMTDEIEESVGADKLQSLVDECEGFFQGLIDESER